MIRLKRVYETPCAEDGLRILVERLWPRGMDKQHAKVDEWLKDIAPSTELRKWFAHDPAKWDDFKTRYQAELAQKKPLIDHLKQTAREQKITLVYAARDEQHNSVIVLKQFLEQPE